MRAPPIWAQKESLFVLRPCVETEYRETRSFEDPCSYVLLSGMDVSVSTHT
jgi:hypothetical protein